MKIKCTCGFYRNGKKGEVECSGKRGELKEVSDSVGKKLIKDGVAVEVEAPSPAEAPATED